MLEGKRWCNSGDDSLQIEVDCRVGGLVLERSDVFHAWEDPMERGFRLVHFSRSTYVDVQY